jgi:hypothetical protein
MPPESLWLQYSIVGILILAAGIIAAAFYKLWRELLGWIELQDTKRDAEREKQRDWESEQNKIRDERWQEFLTMQQEAWLKQDIHHTEAIRLLIAKVEVLVQAVNNHDVWARARGKE